MSTPCKTLILALGGCLPMLVASAKEPPDPSILLDAVRRSSTSARDLTLDGWLRQDRAERRVKEPFVVTMEGPRITFSFTKGQKLIIVLDLARDGVFLQESVNGQPFRRISEEQFGKEIRGMDVNYEDVSMAYLYWPNPRYLEEDRVNDLLTWKLRLNNPKKEGPYDHMIVWVNQESGALVRMVGYGTQGKPLKQMEVVDFKKISGESKADDMWMVTKLKILAVDPERSGKVRLTYMEFKER